MIKAKHHYPTEVLDDVHRFLLSKANSRRKLIVNQKALAAEYGMENTKFHRVMAQLVEEGRIRELSSAYRDRTVIVEDLP